MVVRYGSKFLKSYDRADQKIKAAFEKRRRLFKVNPYHPLLNNHALSRKYHGCHSINITGDWRALYSTREYWHGHAKKKVIIFEALGTHSQLYQ